MRMDLPIQVNVRPSKTSNLIQKEREWMTKPYQPRTFLNLQGQVMKLSSTSHDQRAGRSMVGCDQGWHRPVSSVVWGLRTDGTRFYRLKSSSKYRLSSVC